MLSDQGKDDACCSQTPCWVSDVRRITKQCDKQHKVKILVDIHRGKGLGVPCLTHKFINFFIAFAPHLFTVSPNQQAGYAD